MYRSRYWDSPTAPLYPFGFGLSYTTFAISDLQVSASQVKPGDSITVTAVVTNTGKVAGDEVVQLYIHQRWGRDSRPLRELKGFERVSLQPGETRTVTFHLGPEELRYWSTDAGGWVQEAAAFDIWVGSDSRAELHAEFSVVETPAEALETPPASQNPPAPAGKYDDNTKLGTILDDEKAKAVLHKVAPEIESNPMLAMAKGMTLGMIRAFIPDESTRKKFDDLIARLNAM